MRKRYSNEQKQEILEDLRASGLSRAAYCRRQGLSYQSVSKWASRRTAVKCTGLSLVEVSPSEASERARVSVRIGTSVEVNFCEPVSFRELALFCREVGRC